MVGMEKINFCLNRKFNPRLSVSEASSVPFSYVQLGAVGLRIILVLPQSGRMKPLFRGILLLMLKSNFSFGRRERESC
jgi:hypothetical protein